MNKTIQIIFICFSSIAFGSRPLKSNDAFTLGKSHFQLEIASDIINKADQKLFTFTAVLTFGISDDIDLFVASSIVTQSSSVGFLSFECIDLGVKQKIVSSENFSLSIASGLSSSITEYGFTSPSAFFSLINSITIGQLCLHYNLGYNQNFNDEEYKDIWFSSFGAEYQLDDQIILAADIGIGRDPSIHCSTIQSYVLLGFSYSLFENLSFDTGLSFSLQHQTEIELLTKGVTLSL